MNTNGTDFASSRSGSGPVRPAGPLLVIEEIDGTPDDMPALFTFCATSGGFRPTEGQPRP